MNQSLAWPGRLGGYEFNNTAVRLYTSHAAEGVVLVFCFGVCTRPPAFCLKTRNMVLKVTETRVTSVFTGRTVKLRHLCLTHASRLITALTKRQNRLNDCSTYLVLKIQNDVSILLDICRVYLR